MTDRELIEDLLSALEYHTEQTRPIQFSKVAIEAAREYLRKPAQQQKRCNLCDCTGDIHSPDGEWRGECPHCKPAQQETLEDLHNALQRIDTAAVGLPTFQVRHEGGLDAFTQNIVEAIVALHEQPAQPQQEPVAAAKKDAVFAASIEFIETLTGMQPPPIETAPPEIFKPFRDFTEKVCSIFAAPQPAQQQEPLTDGFVQPVPDKCNRITWRGSYYHLPQPQRKPLTDEEIAKAIGTNTRWPYLSEMLQITRAIEAAHGIKE